MAFFLFVCAVFNIWFVYISAKRTFQYAPKVVQKEAGKLYQLLTHSVFVMALFDIPWVILCTVQCWNNTFTTENSLHQDSGNDSVGCKLMGWYSSFSLVGMMGSHCLVAYYLLRFREVASRSEGPMARSEFLGSLNGLLTLSFAILVGAVLFGSFPLMEGGGYALTNGGFCYANFTNKAQSAVMLVIVVSFLALSTYLWNQIGVMEFWYFYTLFFITWFLWVPATIYGMATGKFIPSPYMIIGAIAGHGNAILNPVLYGKHLFDLIDLSFPQEKSVGPEEVSDLVL